MNYINDIKCINLPITLGGSMEMDYDVFRYIIHDNLEVGDTYLMNLFYKGIPLSIDGEKINPLVFTIPDYESEELPLSVLCNTYERFIRESDLIMEIYREKGFYPDDESVPLSVFKDYNLNLSLICIKQKV